MITNTAKNINILGNFCGKRDIQSLTQPDLQNRYNISQADIMVLFGGSILAGGDILAGAMKNQIARNYIIVGGAGHTTGTLRTKMHTEVPALDTTGLPEARIFAGYLNYKYNLKPDFLECESTNCGNNITHLLDLIERNHIPSDSIIIAQDATMQHRMEAGLRKYIKADTQIINYAVYQAQVVIRDSKLAFAENIWGMWDMEQYITLLMGEIPHLTDDENGYGPRGRDYIAHVDIPQEVITAFEELKNTYPSMVREANPAYSGKRE